MIKDVRDSLTSIETVDRVGTNTATVSKKACPEEKGGPRQAHHFFLRLHEKAKVLRVRLVGDYAYLDAPAFQGFNVRACTEGIKTRGNGHLVTPSQMPKELTSRLVGRQFFIAQNFCFSRHFLEKVAKVLPKKNAQRSEQNTVVSTR